MQVWLAAWRAHGFTPCGQKGSRVSDIEQKQVHVLWPLLPTWALCAWCARDLDVPASWSDSLYTCPDSAFNSPDSLMCASIARPASLPHTSMPHLVNSSAVFNSEPVTRSISPQRPPPCKSYVSHVKTGKHNVPTGPAKSFNRARSPRSGSRSACRRCSAPSKASAASACMHAVLTWVQG